MVGLLAEGLGLVLFLRVSLGLGLGFSCLTSLTPSGVSRIADSGITCAGDCCETIN